MIPENKVKQYIKECMEWLGVEKGELSPDQQRYLFVIIEAYRADPEYRKLADTFHYLVAKSHNAGITKRLEKVLVDYYKKNKEVLSQ